MALTISGKMTGYLTVQFQGNKDFKVTNSANDYSYTTIISTTGTVYALPEGNGGVFGKEMVTVGANSTLAIIRDTFSGSNVGRHTYTNGLTLKTGSKLKIGVSNPF